MFPLMYFIKEVFIIEKEKKYPEPEFSFYLFILSRSQSCFYKGENAYRFKSEIFWCLHSFLPMDYVCLPFFRLPVLVSPVFFFLIIFSFIKTALWST